MKKYYIIFLGLIILFACAKEKELEQPQSQDGPVETEKESITYTLKGVLSENTKALISDEGEFSWESGDKVAVLDSKTGDICEFTSDQDKGTFTFTGEPGREYTFTKAWYPASMVKAEDVISYPATWDYPELSKAHYFPMAASVTGDVMNFYHLGGLLRLTINDVPKNATALTLSSDDVSLSGDYGITSLGLDDGRVDATGENVVKEDGEISVKSVPEVGAVTGDGAVTINLDLPSRQQVVVYVPLPCGSYRYKISLQAGEETILQRATSAAKDIDRAVLIRMSALTVSWPATTLKAMYNSMEVSFEGSDIWGWYVAKNLPKDQSITLSDSGTPYGTGFATKKLSGYLFQCKSEGSAFPLKENSDLYLSVDKSAMFPLPAGSSGQDIVVPDNYEVAHYGLRGDFGEGEYTSKGIFQKTDDVPEGSGRWYVVRNVTCTSSRIAFKLYSTAYSAADGLLVTSTETPQNAGVSRSLVYGENPAVKYNVTAGMAYDIYLKEDLTKVYVCESGSKTSSVDETVLAALTNFGLYQYSGSSYVCATGVDQTWTTASSTTATFVLVDGITFNQVVISDLPLAPSVGDEVTVGVQVLPTIGSNRSSSVTATVIKKVENKVWLLSQDGTGMIVNVQ